MPERKYQYKITEVAAMLNETQATLRYWESEFDSFIKPSTNAHGTRKYTDKDIERLKSVQYLLRERKLTIKGAKAYLKDNVRERVIDNAELVEELRAIKAELLQIKGVISELYPDSETADDDDSQVI